MRSLKKEWQNRRPHWDRRVRWYDSGEHDRDIRLAFEDEHGMTNVWYEERADAQRDYDLFRNGSLTVADVMEARVKRIRATAESKNEKEARSGSDEA